MKTFHTRVGFNLVLLCALVAYTPIAAAADGLGEITGEMLEQGVDSGTSMGSDIVEAYESWEALTEASDALTPGDTQFDPDYTPEGSPEIPSACAESEECNECYEKAVKDINFYRYSLDKGRGIANSTLNYAKAAIAFGDTASGSFGVGGLAWSLDAKPEVEKAVAKLRKTYQSKYTEWMDGLKTSLEMLGQCEEEHFGERDWYARFGYIYYSFMSDRYKSPD